MFYAVVLSLTAIVLYWLWGMSKMTRMNNDPGQVALATLLVRAGSGEDEPLLRAIRDEQWTPLQMSDRIAHALTLAQQMFLAVNTSLQRRMRARSTYGTRRSKRRRPYYEKLNLKCRPGKHLRWPLTISQTFLFRHPNCPIDFEHFSSPSAALLIKP